MRVLVAGGGVGGLAAALALRKAGFTPVVYEAHPGCGQDIGAFLTLAGNGRFALAQVDADQAVDRAGFALYRMRVTAASGAEIATVPLHRYRCLRRAALCAALCSEVRRRGVEIHLGKRLIGRTETAGDVTARFADGGTATPPTRPRRPPGRARRWRSRTPSCWPWHCATRPWTGRWRRTSGCDGPAWSATWRTARG